MKILFSLFIVITISCSLQQKDNTSRQSYEKLATFHDKNEEFVGEAYVRYLSDSVFDTLFIINKQDTIYSIKRDVFFSPNGVDLEVYPEDFYGYKVVLIRPSYIVINYLRSNGELVSDDVTIEWNNTRKIFEVIKAP